MIFGELCKPHPASILPAGELVSQIGNPQGVDLGTHALG